MPLDSLVRKLRPSPFRPIWVQPVFYVPVLIALVLAGSGLFLIQRWPSDPAPVAAPVAAPVSRALRPIEDRAAEWDNREARLAKSEHPAHYKCRQYPSDDKLRWADLIPTGNVVTVIRYNPDTAQYEATSDSRMRLTRRMSTEKANSDVGHDFRMTTFKWTYEPGVEHFATFSYYTSSAPGQPKIWGGGPLGFDKRDNTFNLPASPENGTEYPVFVIMATDTRTCDPSPVTLPSGFDWQGLARGGLLQQVEPAV